MSTDSYLSVHTHPSLEAHELLRILSLKMDRAEEDMVLAVVSHTGGTHTNTQRNAWKCFGRFSQVSIRSSSTILPRTPWKLQKCSMGARTRVGSPCATLLALNCSHILSLSYVSAERRVLHPSDCVYSESLTPQGKLVACRRDLTEMLVCSCFCLSVTLNLHFS